MSMLPQKIYDTVVLELAAEVSAAGQTGLQSVFTHSGDGNQRCEASRQSL